MLAISRLNLFAARILRQLGLSSQTVAPRS